MSPALWGPLGLAWQLIRLGARSLLVHKLRSVLTVLGMVFGVASVVSILAVGEGASAEVQAQLRRLGPDRILIRSVRPPDTSGEWQLNYGLTLADLERIEATVPGMRSIAPSYELEKEVYVAHRIGLPSIVGTTPAFLDIHQLDLARGRFLSWPDVESRGNVAVLGADTARDLFGPVDPLGQEVRFGSGHRPYRVVGLLRPRAEATAALNDPDNSVFIPLTTARLRLENIVRIEEAGGRRYEHVDLHQIGIRVREVAHVEQVAAMLRRLLSQAHDTADYELIVPFELLRQSEHTKRVFSWVLGSIAGISLLVGGIGIMNIMLATVTERTREIGVRRAVGAKRRHVIVQFLIETVILSTAGGVLGLGLGLAIPPLITAVAQMQTVVTPQSLVLALGISVLVGIVSGLYPARRAAMMDPIEALRHG